MHRQIILDTETTGLSPETGHRIIEIGCLELIDRRLTGEQFHVYLNPDRAIDPGAIKVHGIKNEFLADKPRFPDILEDFIAFVKDAELIIHNAPFDMGFLNAELKRAQYPHILEKHCKVFDTLVLAKEKHPGQRNNLDALCKRYDVVNSHRKLHGALLDSELLAFVYLAMTGGQTSLFDAGDASLKKQNKETIAPFKPLTSTSPVHYANEAECAAHEAFMKKVTEKA
ncbi:MAG: DNA polymerase III subunit epsilon [Legionellaceae bacterium]|nr:DNA polymerase III subunit epsilon [Legionellaceae bacterium]